MKTTLHLASLAAALLAAGLCGGAEAGPECTTATGIVSAVTTSESNPKHNWLTLRTPTGDVTVAAPVDKPSFGRLLALTDAEVEVRGLSSSNDRRLKFTGRFLNTGVNGHIKVLRPAPAASEAPEFEGDPRNSEEFARRERANAYLHRVRMCGLLLTGGDSFTYMALPGGAIVKLVLQERAARPEYGTMTFATGFVSFGYGGLQMHDVVFSPAPDAKPVAMPEVWTTTLNNAHRCARFYTRYSRRLVSFTGETSNSPWSVHQDKHFWLQNEGNWAAVDRSGYSKSVDIDTYGTILRVTGVCEPVFGPEHEASSVQRFMGITLTPLPGTGIAVVELTPAAIDRRQAKKIRLLVFLSIHLAIIMVIVSVALVVQRVRYNRRGRQLFEERAAHVRAQAKVDERTRLAAELHDAVSQTLTGVALQIDSANLVNRGGNEALTKCLTTARQMLASCRRELRDCLWDLRSRTFDEKDMTEAVSRAIAPHTGNVRTAVRFNVRRSLLSESRTHAILSMTRELVVNAIKHGKATQIWIAGECSDGHISFSVRDNGCGFDTASAPGPREGHFGIQGICERVRTANGTVKVESVPGKGTKVTVTIPEGE